MEDSSKLQVTQIAVKELRFSEYNPRRWTEEQLQKLKESIAKFGLVDPLIVNSHPSRKNIVIGGNMRLKVLQEMGCADVGVVFVNLTEDKEKDLNVRLNHTGGDWDFDLLKEFDEELLIDIGFSDKELDIIFDDYGSPEETNTFNLQQELRKVGISSVTVEKGHIYQLGDSRLMCGDSTNASGFSLLMSGEKADMCLTDPPYILDYSGAIRGGKPVTNLGSRRNRRYLETESLPDNFTELWMKNIADHAKPNFSIICYENWKNLRIIWSEMEKYWKVRNMIVWHIPGRHQGFASRHKFFSKHDIAMVGGSGEVAYNTDEEEESLQETYETALYAISGKPEWEEYDKSKPPLPTDFIEFDANDEKSSGQGVVFGVKPLEILIPYMKVLTKRGDLVVEPFCGSGSTLIAATKLKRRCYIMEKSPVYAEIAISRWERETELKRQLISPKRGGDDEKDG